MGHPQVLGSCCITKSTARNGCATNEHRLKRVLLDLSGLGAEQDAGAEGGEFGDEGCGFAAGEGGGVDFGYEELGGGYIGAAL